MTLVRFSRCGVSLTTIRIAGLVWIVGLFVVLWFILKTMRNNRQVAFLASVARALDLYLSRSK